MFIYTFHVISRRTTSLYRLFFISKIFSKIICASGHHEPWTWATNNDKNLDNSKRITIHRLYIGCFLCYRVEKGVGWTERKREEGRKQESAFDMLLEVVCYAISKYISATLSNLPIDYNVVHEKKRSIIKQWSVGL